MSRNRKSAALLASRVAALKARSIPFVDRLARNIELDGNSGCWLWSGYCYGNGYACMSWQGKQVLLHRLAYEQLIGPIPDGMVIDHLCRIKNCVNPDHLEVVTGRENTRRAMRTHCVNGHEFSESNTYVPADGKRYCRTCRRERNRRRGQNVA